MNIRKLHTYTANVLNVTIVWGGGVGGSIEKGRRPHGGGRRRDEGAGEVVAGDEGAGEVVAGDEGAGEVVAGETRVPERWSPETQVPET